MSWDIYGQPLRRGYCEVHPDVLGEYPCAICVQEGHEAEQRREYEEAERRHYEEMERDHYLTMEHEALLEAGAGLS